MASTTCRLECLNIARAVLPNALKSLEAKPLKSSSDERAIPPEAAPDGKAVTRPGHSLQLLAPIPWGWRPATVPITGLPTWSGQGVTWLRQPPWKGNHHSKRPRQICCLAVDHDGTAG